ncbi:uncharacterized protein LOC132758734 isoform X2 [Ruditapes philippinarum]|uniref:uncharacterized protein LOC132758734 isoform X2 n=1 Tax=Ruditapes philippinarum TaxID=129788 RepID=UPI00295BBE97|nr:uncharacterized protein LOC132758734 isoform X2 [Ruditapes philippinarum]
MNKMPNHSRWSRTCVTKTVIIVVIILISLQYLVNVAIFRHNDSIIFLQLLDSSFGKMLNQTGINMKGRMRDSVTKMEKPLEPCPIIPPKLQGHVKVNAQVAAWAYIEQENSMLKRGGRYKPPDCIARNRVAVIIPYRDREIHLKIFLRNMHPFLQRQQLDYGIFVVEMEKNIRFNRALLMNVGFVEAMKQYDYQCFIFHDVDLLPEDDRNLYTCPQFPRHMSVAIDRLQYKLPYAQIFGGVSAISTEQFRNINGFSNIFFGWGGEDDDMYRRILYSNLTVIRYSPEVARYKMLIHVKENGNSDRFMLLRTVKARQKTDGITSLKYKVEKMELTSLYTWILVSVNETEIIDAEPIHKLAAKHLRRGKLLPNPNPVQGKVAQGKMNSQVNSGKLSKAIQPEIIKPVQKVNVAQNDDKNKEIKQGNLVQSESKNQGLQGKEVKSNVEKTSNTKSAAKVNLAMKNTVKNTVNEKNKDKPKDPTKNMQVKTDAKAASVPKLKPNEPKIKLIAGLARRKSIKFVSWIPNDFKGILPTNLTKFEPLPHIVPPHVNKKKALLDRLAKSKNLQNQVIINRSSTNIVNSVDSRKSVHEGNDVNAKNLPLKTDAEVRNGGNKQLPINANKESFQTIVNAENSTNINIVGKQIDKMKALR